MTKIQIRLIQLFTFIFLISININAQTEEIKTLLPEKTIERELAGGQTHKYKIEAKAKEFISIEVEQKNIEIVVSLIASDNKTLITMDGKNGFLWRESVSAIAEMDGVFQVEITAYGNVNSTGSYTIKLTRRLSNEAIDRKRIEAESHLALGRKLYEQGGDQYEEAISAFKKSVKLWKELNISEYEGIALVNLGWMYYLFSSYEEALALLNQAALILKETKDIQGESKALNIIGSCYIYLAQYKTATDYFEKSLILKRMIKDRRGEGITLARLGSIQRFIGKYEKALDYLEQALKISREVKRRLDEANALNSLALIYRDLGQYGKAIEYYEQALPITREFNDRLNESAVLNNLADIFALLNRYDKAQDYLERSLVIAREMKDKGGESNILFNLGNSYFFAFKNYEKALEYYQLTLNIKRELNERNGEAHALNALGNVYTELKQYKPALDYFTQSLKIRREINDRNGEMATLNGLGVLSKDSGKSNEAKNYYEQAMTIAREIHDKQGEGDIAINLMVIWAKLNNIKLSIFYGKWAINLYQEIRNNIGNLDKGSQQSFLSSIEVAYRMLAELLIIEGRLLEAEQVLAMLKEEEVFDYLRRDASETDKLSQRADLTPKEKDALKRYEEIADKITAFGVEFGALEELQRKNVKFTDEQQKRFDELSKQLEDANRYFQALLKQLAEEFSKRSNTKEDLQENLGLQGDLKKWGKGIVFLYTLVGEDRYRTILVTPDTQTDGKTEIKAEDLNKKIFEFRCALQNPTVDPRPLGKELYDILIKPIEKQLDGAKAKTLLWSLDGNLRLLPLAALWDGKQYFGQKYENVTITLASRTRLSEAVSKDWRVLGLGVSEGKTVKIPDGAQTREVNFNPLFAVKEELASIVKVSPNERGVLPGQRFLNTEFTEAELKKELPRGYKVVHIASHFSLNPGDSRQSFLLLGDGTALTVDEIKISPQLKFDDVELLTLSACQTAVVEKDSTGKEMEGFGYVAQQKGAKAILATLWKVEDESTQIFMTEFYRLRNKNPKLTKVEAIRLVQKAMIEGKFQPVTDRKGRTATSDEKVLCEKFPRFEKDESKPFSHPYYWAPFVLIGNWK